MIKGNISPTRSLNQTYTFIHPNQSLFTLQLHLTTVVEVKLDSLLSKKVYLNITCNVVGAFAEALPKSQNAHHQATIGSSHQPPSSNHQRPEIAPRERAC